MQPMMKIEIHVLKLKKVKLGYSRSKNKSTRKYENEVAVF
jgi:hypothetical protein